MENTFGRNDWSWKFYRGPALAAPIFPQFLKKTTDPKLGPRSLEFFSLVEHSRPNFNVANNSLAMQAQEFCSQKNPRIPSEPLQQRNHVTTNPQSNHA
jgi:hypothetical protein